MSSFDDNGWNSGGYRLFRVALGAYLAVHFAALVPFAAELFSSAGMVSDASLSPLARAFPNVLGVWDGPAAATALVAAAAAAALLLACGIQDRASALFVLYTSACLLGRNPLIANPALPYLGWLLLAHALLPRPVAGTAWRMPGAILAAAWIVMAAGYSFSGLTKLASPSWRDGSAVAFVLENPLARDTALRAALLSLPPALLRFATWGALGLELLAAPLALVPRLRPWLWLALAGMHVSLIALIDFADLSGGMLLLHAFTFDPAWLRALSFRPSFSKQGVDRWIPAFR